MKQIQDIRVSLHARTLDIEKLSVTSRERSLAITTCQQGRMLLGKVLQLLGGSTPYPQSDNPNNSVVAPAVDVVSAYEPRLPKDEIPAVKEIRSRMQVALDGIESIRNEIGGLAQAQLDAAYAEISLSKNWLGMDLARLAESPNMPAGAFSARPPAPVTTTSAGGATVVVATDAAAATANAPAAEVVAFPSGSLVASEGEHGPGV